MLRILLLLAVFAAPARAADEALSPAANAAFLAANARKPGVIVRPSGLQYRVLRSGTGKRPGGDDVVQLAYSVRLINGAVADATSPVLPDALSMSALAMAGLGEALPLMHVGDRWQLAIPANLAFGAKSALGGVVPPNQTLIFDLTLLAAAPPRPGEAVGANPFSVWSNGRENGAALTIHP